MSKHAKFDNEKMEEVLGNDTRNDSGERRLQKKQDLDINHSANRDEHNAFATHLASDAHAD